MSLFFGLTFSPGLIVSRSRIRRTGLWAIGSGDVSACSTPSAALYSTTQGPDKKGKMKMPLERFFRGYPQFNYNPAKSSISEFARLCQQSRWVPAEGTRVENPKKTRARERFKTAMIEEFEAKYGTESVIDDIKALRLALSLRPAHESDKVISSRKAAGGLADLLVGDIGLLSGALADMSRRRRIARDAEQELRLSMLKKIYPGGDIDASWILRSLLRDILDADEATKPKSLPKSRKETS